MGWRDRDERFELHLTRRDGQRINRQPRAVTEVFELDNDKQREEIVGKHFVHMAAAAEGRTVRDHQRISEFSSWLPKYQLEIWHERFPHEPVMVSTSTRGWRD